ncbi:MAG TPA: transposase [Actinomycetes bacterium]|nr:transposase [Actinomycetes bacterium]
MVRDGQTVVDVPPKLSARMRVYASGQGRKTDATDAHSVAMVGTRIAGLRPVADDQQLTVLRLLVDRRRSLGEDHTRMTSQLHQLLLELIPGGAKKDLSAAQAKVLLARVRPRDAAGKVRRRVAAELIADLERVYARSKAADKELKVLVAATGTHLMDLHGIGPSGAADQDCPPQPVHTGQEENRAVPRTHPNLPTNLSGFGVRVPDGVQTPRSGTITVPDLLLWPRFPMFMRVHEPHGDAGVRRGHPTRLAAPHPGGQRLGESLSSHRRDCRFVARGR